MCYTNLQTDFKKTIDISPNNIVSKFGPKI